MRRLTILGFLWVLLMASPALSALRQLENIGSIKNGPVTITMPTTSGAIPVSDSVGSDFVPSVPSTYSLGSPTNYWASLYTDSIVDQFNSTGNLKDVLVADGTGKFFWFPSNIMNNNLLPGSDATYALGSAVERWTTLHSLSTTLYGVTSGNVAIGAADTTADYSLRWPPAQGAPSTFLQNDGSGNLSWVAGGGGGANTSLSNLVGPLQIPTDLTNDGGGYNIGTGADPWGILYLSGNIQDGSSVTAFDITSRSIFDTSGNDSVDGQNRLLRGGSTISWATSDSFIMRPSTTGQEQVITTFDTTDPVPDLAIRAADGVSGAGGRVILRPGDGTGTSLVRVENAPGTTTETQIVTDTFTSNNATSMSLSTPGSASITGADVIVNGAINLNGSTKAPIRQASGVVTLSATTDRTLIIDNSAAQVTVNMPPCTDGLEYFFNATDNGVPSVNDVTFVADGLDVFQGGSGTVTLPGQIKIHSQCLGGTWWTLMFQN